MLSATASAAVSLRTRHTVAGFAGGPPDLDRPEEWERQGFGDSLGLFSEVHSLSSRERRRTFEQILTAR
jgi:hypothetical protein